MDVHIVVITVFLCRESITIIIDTFPWKFLYKSVSGSIGYNGRVVVKKDLSSILNACIDVQGILRLYAVGNESFVQYRILLDRRQMNFVKIEC